MLSNPFKWKHYEGDIILLNVRWYLKYALSYRNLKEMMVEREIEIDHTMIMRWVHQYSPELEKRHVDTQSQQTILGEWTKPTSK
jgi:transposase-like protein